MTENDSKPQNEVSLNKVYSQKIRHLSNSQKISYLNEKKHSLIRKMERLNKEAKEQAVIKSEALENLKLVLILMIPFSFIFLGLLAAGGGWYALWIAIIITIIIFQSYIKTYEHREVKPNYTRTEKDLEILNVDKELSRLYAKQKEDTEQALIFFTNKINSIKGNIEDFKVVDVSIIEKKLNDNKSDLDRKDSNYLHKIVRLSIYINNKSENIKTLKDIILNFKDFEGLLNWRKEYKVGTYEIPQENINKWIEFFNQKKLMVENYIKSLNLMTAQCLSMIDYFLKDEKVNFLILYESFDTLGVFDSNWEKQVKSSLNDVNSNILNLMSINEKLVEYAEFIGDEVGYLSAVNEDIYWEIIKN